MWVRSWDAKLNNFHGKEVSQNLTLLKSDDNSRTEKSNLGIQEVYFVVGVHSLRTVS